MSIPVSWLSAVLPSSIPAVQATAKSLANSTAQVFGALLPTRPAPANGPWGPTSTKTSNTWDSPNLQDPKGSEDHLRTRLAQLISTLRARMGLGGSTQEPIHIAADGVGIPQVEGPEPLRQTVQEILYQDSDLVSEINAASRQQRDADPLRWMPGFSNIVRWTVPAQNASRID